MRGLDPRILSGLLAVEMHCQVTAGNDDKGTAAVQMNFDFTEEQKLFADSVRRFALAPFRYVLLIAEWSRPSTGR